MISHKITKGQVNYTFHPVATVGIALALLLLCLGLSRISPPAIDFSNYLQLHFAAQSGLRLIARVRKRLLGSLFIDGTDHALHLACASGRVPLQPTCNRNPLIFPQPASRMPSSRRRRLSMSPCCCSLCGCCLPAVLCTRAFRFERRWPYFCPRVSYVCGRYFTRQMKWDRKRGNNAMQPHAALPIQNAAESFQIQKENKLSKFTDVELRKRQCPQANGVTNEPDSTPVY